MKLHERFTQLPYDYESIDFELDLTLLSKNSAIGSRDIRSHLFHPRRLDSNHS